MTRLKTAIATLAFGLLTANLWAVTPIVYWNGDFGTASKTGTDGNTYTLTLNGNSVENGNLVINSSNGSNKGAYLTVNDGNFGRALSVLVKYSGLTVPTGAANVFAGIKDSSNNKVAIRMSSNGAKDLKGCIDAGGYNGTAIASLADGSAAREEGYVLFCYNCGSGTAVFSGSSLASLAGGAGTGLRYSTDTINITTLGLGGSAVTSVGTNPSWDGLKIEKIAIFKNTDAVSWSNSSSLTTSYFEGFTWPGEMPDAAFTYNGATKALTGWLTSWQESGDSAQAIGPSAKGAVALINQDSAGKWHPYGTIAALANDFTWSMYINMDLFGKMPNQQDESNGVANGKGDKRIIIRLGDTNAGLHLVEDNGALKLCKNNDADSTIVIPAANITPGYHLVTITRSSTGGVALYLDDGTVKATDPSYMTAINTGFQLGLGCGFKRGYGVAVAQIVGYAQALTPAQVKILSSVYPATTQATGVLTFNGVNKKLFAGNITHTAGRLEVNRGTLYVPENITYTVPALRFGNAQTESQGFGLELDGTLVVNGSSSTKNGNASNGIRDDVTNNRGGILFGEWEGIGTYNIRGTLDASSQYVQLIYDANAQTYNVSGTMKVKGLQADTASSKVRSSHVINIKNGGQLISTEAFSRGKLMANVEAGGVIEIAHTANTSMDSHDMSGITGTGAIKFSGSPWISLPTDASKMFAPTLEVVNESSNGILLGSNTTFTIGPMSGSGALRYDSGASGDGAAGARELCIVQSKDTTWAGNILSQGSSTRELNIHLTSTTGSTFTRTGQCADAKARFTVDEGATLQLEHNGSGNGNIVVLNGGKLTTTGHTDAHGKIVRELSLTANSTFESTSNIFGIGHSNADSKLSLGGYTLTITAPQDGTRFYLDKVTVASAGTINVTKGKLFFHCSVPTLPADTKVIIGANATIEVAGELKNSHTLSIPELEYNGVLPATTDVPNLTVTGKLSGTGTINKLTLGDGAEVFGQVTVTTTATLSGTITLKEADATLKVPSDIADWQTKVLSGVAEKVVAYNSETKTFSLESEEVTDPAATIGESKFRTLASALLAARDGETVTLVKAVTENVTIPVGVTVATTSEIQLTGTVTGAGELVYDAKSSATLPSFTLANDWTGLVTVQDFGTTMLYQNTWTICNVELTANNGLFSKVGSKVKFRGVCGHCNNATLPIELILENSTTTGREFGWKNDNGWSSSTTVFDKLSGSGKFLDVFPNNTQPIIFKDASSFTGDIDIKGKKLTLGAATNQTEAKGQIAVAGPVTFKSGATWTPGEGGVKIARDGVLTVEGEFNQALKGTGKVVYSDFPTNQTVLNSLTQSTWAGTVSIASVEKTGQLNLAPYGNASSTLEINGFTGTSRYLPNGSNLPFTLKVSGDLTFNQGSSSTSYTIAKVTGAGNLSLLNWSGSANNDANHGYTITKLEDYTGTLTTTRFTTIAELALASEPEIGERIVTLGSGSQNTLAVTRVTVGGVALTSAKRVEVEADGIYCRKGELNDEETIDVFGSRTMSAMSVGDAGHEIITGTGGVLVGQLAVKDGGKITLDPVRTPILLTSGVPTFEAGSKIALDSKYANNTKGKFTIAAWTDATAVTQLPAFDTTSAPNAAHPTFAIESYTTTQEGSATQKTYYTLTLDLDPTLPKTKLKVMPLGDSITEGSGSSGNASGYNSANYRVYLMKKLAAEGYDVESVGYRKVKNIDCAGVWQPEKYSWHSGVSGERLITSGGNNNSARVGLRESIEAVLEASGTPDIITIKIGTNDSGTDVETLYTSWTNAMWRIIKSRPNAKIVVGTIMDINGQNTWENGWNDKLRATVGYDAQGNKLNVPGFPANQVFFADLNKANPRYANGETGDYLNTFCTQSDLHPNWVGHEKNAECWFTEIKKALAAAGTGAAYVPNTNEGAANNVPSMFKSGFTHLRTFKPSNASPQTAGSAISYAVSNGANDTVLTKVAYYMELKHRQTGNVRWVWADMDAWSTAKTLGSMALSTTVSTQIGVSKLHVCSNDSGIEEVLPTDDAKIGWLVITPKDTNKNDHNVSGAPTGLLAWDWNNTINESANYGLFQLFRVGQPLQPAATTLMAYNNWFSDNQEVGIGSCALHGGSTTFANIDGTIAYKTTSAFERLNLGAYELASIEIWGKPESYVDPFVVTIAENTASYPTIDAAMEAAAAATTAEVKPVIAIAEGIDTPAGFVKGEDGVLTACDYIVISPSSYVSNWQTYVAARKTSPAVVEDITFGVKNAAEIYAAYRAVADATDGTPRNDAESIHKWIGIMQKLGTKYFVLGGCWKDVAGGWTDGDRPTMIPGIAVYPKLSKANASVLDVISSDLYYACHYKADRQDYVWDPSGDQVYVGLHETNADEMEDVRHFQPSCVVSRMNFHAATYGGVEKTYPELIVAYTAKLQRGEDSERFGGTDRYAVWASRCKSDVDGKPDCYPAQKARAEYIPTVRSAKEVFFNYLPDTHTAEQANEARGEILGQDWELLLPVEHGTAGGLGNLDCDHVKNADKIIKFFMGNVPCMTGQVFANGCFADTALSNPNGGTLVSINNTSLGYASESGMAERKCGVSDELVDWCLDSYIGGSTAGEAWRTAIATFAGRILTEDGFVEGALAARDHEGSSTETVRGQQIQVENKCYVIAAMIEEMLFGDPLVRIQTEKGGNTLAATVERAASVKSVCAADFREVLEDFGAADAVSLTIKGNSCGSAATAVTVPAGKTLTVNLNATLVAETVTVAGTLSGSGTVDGNLSFSAGATLDASKANKIRVATGKTIAADAVGINVLLAADTPVPAVKTLAVLDQDGCASTGPAVKSVMAGTKALSGPFALVGERNQFFLTRDASVPLYVDKNTSNKGAVVLSVYVTSETGVETLLEKSGEGEQHWQIPAGANVKVTYGPDVSHSGEPNTIVVNAVYATKDITDLIPAYANGREPTTIFWNAGSGPYTGDMDGRMHMVSPYGDSVEFVATKIVDGDTIVFDPHVNKFGAVQHDVSLKDFIPVVSDAKGAELHIDVNLMMTARDADDPIFGGMRVSIQSGSTLTLKPTAANLTLGNVEFNGGSLVMTTDEASKVVKIDEIKGTTPIDIRAPLKVQSKTQGAPVAISGRVTGNGTIDAPVEIHSGARVLVSGAEYLTITGAFTTKADNEADGYHRLTVDAMATKDSLQKDSDGKYHHPILKLASKAEAEAAIPHVVLVEPEVTVDGKFVNFELKADETGLIYMTELAFIQKDGFFVDGVLNRGNEVVWSYNSAFQDGVSSIRAACPAEIRFDFTGAGSGTTITVDKSIILTGDNELLFDVPEGRTVYVNCEISGTAGIKKIGKGTLVFGLPAGVEEGVSPNQAGWNTFLGALVVEEGLVRSTKAHGYGTRHTFSDGEFDPPQIDIHHGATLDLGNICDQEHIEIISAGTITNSVHDATNAAVGQIQKLTLKGDTTVTGHTFGMAHNSIIDLQGHVLTISMARGTCVMVDDGGRREVHDHEFELDNTTVQGGRDNLDTPDIVVLQGTLSCEGSTYDQETETFTMGENNLLNASLKVGAEACLRLNANLTVRRIEIVNGNAPVSVPCDNVTSADPEPHFHTFPKVWETSAKPGALDMTEKDDKFFGHIIILYQLKGGITAPRITFGAEDIYSTSVAWAAGGIYDPDVQTIMLDKGEHIECKEQLTLYGFPFNAIFFDWDGQSGVRRLFHGWNKFAAEDRALSAIITPFAYIKTGEGKMDYKLVTCDWYPWGAYADEDRSVEIRNTNPLCDPDWAYAIPLWNPLSSQRENVIIATIKKFDGQDIYVDNKLNGTALTVTNGFLSTTCPRGDNAMDFVIGTDWLSKNYPDWEHYAPGKASVSDWLDEKGANGIERWQSYMLGLDPTKADSLPVLAVRKDTAPSFVKNGETYVNVTVAGVDCYGYQYISPIYAIEELAIGADGKPITATSDTSAVTPWQTDKHFQVLVPTDGHVKYFRVKVSFQGNDGITN